MKIITLAATAIIVLATTSVYAADEFATLKGVTATPMAASELDAVKGLHLHAFNAAGNLILLGGPGINESLLTYDNGSDDGGLVHNGYHGLCVAGPISIPPAGMGPSTGLNQCP